LVARWYEHERVRLRCPGNHVGIPACERIEERTLISEGDAGPNELEPASVWANSRGQPARLEAGSRIRRALETQDGRHDEQTAGDERGHRISGQPEDQPRVTDPEGDGFPGLHGNTPEHLLHAELGSHPADEIMRPDRDAAGRHENVGLETTR